MSNEKLRRETAAEKNGFANLDQILCGAYKGGTMNRREILHTLAALTGAAALPRRDRAEVVPFPGNPAQSAKTAGQDAPNLVTLFDYEAVFPQRVEKMAYDYISGGAGDEISLRRNHTAYEGMRLKPRVLRDVSRIDTSVELFGQKLNYPILLAPTAYHKLVHPEGELATARGAGAAGTTMVVSSFATTAIEDVAKAATGTLWFQLYVQPDRSFTKDLVQRAESAGCKALCITVDTPVAGTRNREMRDRFQLPANLSMENLRALGEKVRQHRNYKEGYGEDIYSVVLDPTLTWDGIDWIRSFAKVPILLKGILSPEDARLAVQHGAAGVVVSNHGARNLDTVPATIEALPGVVEAVEGRVPVIVDGGIRRGTDLVKALALGARAVQIGRPYLWGLSVAGPEGVRRICEILVTELRATMALCGRPTLASIDRTVLWPEK